MTSDPSTPRLVILGSGFGALRTAQKLRRSPAKVTIVSPRNHFLFSPLLISSTIGSVEFRNVIEPIRDACPHAEYFQASAVSLDAEASTVTCQSPQGGAEFTLTYDDLVIAVGGKNGTFGIPGVREHTLFLKEVADADKIRRRILGCLERAELPGISESERDRLLHWIVVGAGPTGSEFVAELNDFLRDVKKRYPGLKDKIRLTLLEACNEILPSFDESLRSYAERQLKEENITVRKQAPAKEVREHTVVLEDGEEVSGGLIVWSTGIAPRDWIQECGLPTNSRGFLRIDNECRVVDQSHIFAIGDTARMEDSEYPATAQLAQQQGKYLGKAMARRLKNKPVTPFHFHNLGMMAYLGDHQAMADLPKGAVTGRLAWLMWKSVYFTKLVGWRNKIRLLGDWLHARLFGRETSRIP